MKYQLVSILSGVGIDSWQVLEDMKDKGELTASLGVSNFRPQDLEAILKVCKYKPVVNRAYALLNNYCLPFFLTVTTSTNRSYLPTELEYHPFVLSHLQPVLDIHAAHGIRTVAYGLLSPILRHPSRGGPLRPIISRIAARISAEYGKPIGEAEVLLLWTVGTGAVAVSASGNPKNIKALAEVYSGKVPTLTKEEIEEITEVGKKIHWRNYVGSIKLGSFWPQPFILLLTISVFRLIFAAHSHGSRLPSA